MKKNKRGIYEKIINIFLDVLIFVFGLILIVSIYNNIQIKILGNEYSSFFGYSTFEVQTGSMADTINPGDWIIVNISKNIKLDDIITYSKDGEFITHRVVESYKGTYITKGDANNSKDEPINKGQVVGKVVKILPGFGIIRKTFFNPIVLFTLIITLYSFSYILRINVKKDKDAKSSFNYREKIDGLVTFIIKKVKSLISANSDEIKKDEDNNVVDDNVLNIDEELMIDIPEIKTEDMDKTMHFRIVSVDKLELDDTYQQIADNEYKLKKDDSKILGSDSLDSDKENLDVIKEKVDLIQRKRKKFKNIIDKVVFIKREEINEIIGILTGNENTKLNEPTIRETLLTAYMDVKYYNFCGNYNVEYNKKNMLSRIDSEIKKIGENLVLNYKGSDTKYKEKVDKYVNIYSLINYLEQSNHLVSELQVKRGVYKSKIVSSFKEQGQDIVELDIDDIVNEIIKLQKIYQGVINYIFEKLNTNTFNLSMVNITGKKKFFAVSLKHNISFSKVYSDYIVDKTYTEGIIAEDKVLVLLNLLFMHIIKDMFSLEAEKKYFISIPNTMYVKPNKLDKIFKLFDDEFAKNSIVVVVEYKDLVAYKKQIMALKKKGYHFAVSFDNNDKIKDSEQTVLDLMDYLFIDKKVMNYNIISSIPDDLDKCIIYDDIVSKFSSLGGE